MQTPAMATSTTTNINTTTSPTNMSMEMASQAAPTCKLACVMVGLPARGKTFISRKVARYFTWLGHRARIFNVGNYRRDVVGAVQPSAFFDPDNTDFSRQRTEVAMLALDDMLDWFDHGGDDGMSVGSLNSMPQFGGLGVSMTAATAATPAATTDAKSNHGYAAAGGIGGGNENMTATASVSSPPSAPSKGNACSLTNLASPRSYSTPTIATAHNIAGSTTIKSFPAPSPRGSVFAQGAGEPACVALYDATNSTADRREIIERRCRERGVDVLFIESICNDPEVIMANIREVKLSSPDYKGVDTEQAIEDFQRRIQHYERSYQPLHPSEIGSNISFIKLIDVGDQVWVNKARGYIQSRVVYFLMNLNITPRSFYFSRHGESMFNVMQRIGGDAGLSPRGEAFCKKLPGVIQRDLGHGMQLTIWTSTLRRTIETARHFKFPKLQWKQLNELDSGVCDGLTYEEIAERYPNDFNDRDADKFNYRYHGGESYRDLVQRLEPVIMELERHRELNHSIYIIGHQAVLRAIYAYFLNIPHEELPYIKVPLHTIVKLSPKAYGCKEEHFAVDVPAVDTHRDRPAKPIVRGGSTGASSSIGTPIDSTTTGHSGAHSPIPYIDVSPTFPVSPRAREMP